MNMAKYRQMGESAAVEDIDAGNRCDLAAIDEGAVLAHVGMEYGGQTAGAIADQLRADGADADEIARAVSAAADAVLDGYREAMAEALPKCPECGRPFDPEHGDGGTLCSVACRNNQNAGDRAERTDRRACERSLDAIEARGVAL